MYILGVTTAAASTFSRFFPRIKARYDYGVLIFILTFCLVSVSGYRVEKIVELAHQRLSTILIGGATCIFISLFICPVWAGETLHNTIASNIEKLANYLEGMLINLSLSIIFECIPRFIYLFIFSLLKIKTKKTLNIIIIGVYRIWR